MIRIILLILLLCAPNAFAETYVCSYFVPGTTEILGKTVFTRDGSKFVEKENSVWSYIEKDNVILLTNPSISDKGSVIRAAIINKASGKFVLGAIYELNIADRNSGSMNGLCLTNEDFK